MALKTQPNSASVTDFLAAISHPTRRQDGQTLLTLYQDITQAPAVMWGESIVGFGQYQYQQRGETLQWMQAGFSPRKQNLSLYIMNGFGRYAPLLAKLGKHKTAVSCLYINKLADVDQGVLRELVQDSWLQVRAGHRIC
ncbi:DUF1801 domain-containing protein [Simiduia sp. 21SJ11W-1]|uniref:DUF1801 domain-containing protein n=1 Tax=Simiduia sp. 21SJ11W-1 TaxID=2909669 RepID=UPI00209D9B1B|nr:DUF1801 domain-containing protein [Simiduia sp. 21SJ11W-1]UTA46916.1 DUF1801 domain-containing protein [Simiduia sp. 21SJ11W-1]